MSDVTNILSKISQGGENAEVYQDLGKAYIKIGEISKALDAFLLSLGLDDQDPWTLLYIGNVYFRKKMYRDSIVWFEKSMLLNRDSGVPYWCLAEAFEKLGEDDSADFYFRKAAQIEPESDEAQKRLRLWVSKKSL